MQSPYIQKKIFFQLRHTPNKSVKARNCSVRTQAKGGYVLLFPVVSKLKSSSLRRFHCEIKTLIFHYYSLKGGMVWALERIISILVHYEINRVFRKIPEQYLKRTASNMAPKCCRQRTSACHCTSSHKNH